MPAIALARPLRLTTDDGVVHDYPAGYHKDVPAKVADHWYTKAHLVPDNRKATAEAIADGREGGDAALGLQARAEAAEATSERVANELQRLALELSEERAAHDETKRLLDEATAPDASDKADGEYAVKRGHQGKYKVMKGEEIVSDGLSKADAETKVEELNKA